MEKSHSEATTRIMTGIIIAIVICVVLLFSHGYSTIITTLIIVSFFRPCKILSKF